MPLYFYVHDGEVFTRRVRPVLTASWRQRSFEPCHQFCRDLLPAARAFAQQYHLGAEEPLVEQVAAGLPFERDFWRLLAGEILLFGAVEIPEIQTAPESFRCLLAPDRYGEESTPRHRLAPIQQVHHGSRDLDFGTAFYRPDHVGWNDRQDVLRLAGYLSALDPGRWTVADLAQLRGFADDEERAEELSFLRDWFPPVRDLYLRAADGRQVIICEDV